MHDQHNTPTQSTGNTTHNVTLSSTGEMIAGSNEILNARPELAMMHQTSNQMTNTQIPEGASINSPNFQQHQHFGIPSGYPQFQAHAPPFQNILADIHNKLLKLNCLDEILMKISNLETRFLHMEQTVNYLTEEVAKCKTNSSVIENTASNIKADLAKTKDDLLDLQTRTMRDNLVFFNIPEKPNEKPEETEQILYEFIEHDMKLDSEQAKNISFERVHRSGPIDKKKHRKIVAKFSFHKEREIVRSHSKNLKGTNFFVREQFPTEVIEARKRLYPVYQEAKKNNQRASLVVNRLYIDGKEVKVPDDTK